MNLRDSETLKWCKKNRPDLLVILEPLLTNGNSGGFGNEKIDQAYRLLLGIGFEAGRQFQASRPKTELNNPNVYLEPAHG